MCGFPGSRASSPPPFKGGAVRRIVVTLIASVSILTLIAAFATASARPAAVTDALVSVGSPSGNTPENHQNEPAVAVDAHNPDVLVAGSNDVIDDQPCPQETATDIGSCLPNPRPNVGISGVYFSFDRSHTWTQPTYTGWSARNCAPTTPCDGSVGPIGTLPWYYESGLVSFGDPAVAIGPKPGP